MRVLTVADAEALGGLVAGSAVAARDPDTLACDGADAHRVVVDEDGTPAARCSLWWRGTARHLQHGTGLIGHYAASDARSAARLLAAACEELVHRGCTLAIGPMDGSTWRSYRFVTVPGEAPPFALEPTNPASWPEQFRVAGFQSLATYTSAVTRRLDLPDPRLPRSRDRFLRLGIRVRTLREECFEEELRRIHRIASTSFRGNLLYTPIAASRFVEHYRPVQQAIESDLVFLAEHDDDPIAFLFMIPDFAQAARGESVDTAVLKTVAVLPGSAYVGLGTYLVGYAQERAHELGYHHVIHALMHDTNASMNISRKYATPMRRYTLFSKDLQPTS